MINKSLTAIFAWHRLWAMIIKEFIQMKRDRGTLGMLIGIPLIQVILFGFAINNNPRHLAAALIDADNSQITRTFIASLQNTKYFAITHQPKNEKEAEQLMAKGKVQFIISIPAFFTHDLIHGNRPALLIEADATDPVAAGNAISAATRLIETVFHEEFQGSLSYLQRGSPPFELRIHSRYNPEAITQFNIVPGLIGVVLTMSMAMTTAIAITRERERGTMENLLAMPIQPIEVMLGKVTPFIIVGYLQVCLILLFAYFLFKIPMEGSLLLLLICVLPFTIANLCVGITVSTIAKNQLQAVQMSTFYFLPSLLLSGFMFPFYGMPMWARTLGEMLPLTHFLRIARGILLKGNGLVEIWPNLWPIFVFIIAVIILGLKRYRRTLD